MILGSLYDILVWADGVGGFLLGLLAGWWLWRHRPPDRRYSIDLVVRKPDQDKE